MLWADVRVVSVLSSNSLQESKKRISQKFSFSFKVLHTGPFGISHNSAVYITNLNFLEIEMLRQTNEESK